MGCFQQYILIRPTEPMFMKSYSFASEGKEKHFRIETLLTCTKYSLCYLVITNYQIHSTWVLWYLVENLTKEGYIKRWFTRYMLELYIDILSTGNRKRR